MSMMAGKPFWQRVALWGVALFLVTPVLYAIAAFFGDFGIIVFAAIIAIVALIAGAIIMFWRKWGLLVGLIVGVLALLFVSDGLFLDLASPQSFFDFTSKLTGLLGAILIIIGSAIGFWQSMKGSLNMGSNGTFARAVMGLVGVIAVLSVISLIISVAGVGGVSAADKQGAEILVAKKAKFDRTEIPVKANGTTKIVVENKDPYLHTFTVEGLNIDVKLGPGDDKLIEINNPGSGEFYFKCKVSGHEEDMHGNLKG